MALIDDLRKNSTTKFAAPLPKSKVFNEIDTTITRVFPLNIALSGSPLSGFDSGITFLAGPSKHFKSNMALVLVKSYLDQFANEDAVCIFLDSEFGTRADYFKNAGIDPNRVLHVPFLNIEELKFELSKQLENIERGQKIIIYIDSVGNSASKKEAEDALKGDSKVDMTRAKDLKGLWRIITPHLTMKNIPCIAVNHTYKTMEMYAKDVMGGGTGGVYSANNIIFIGRQQEKEGTELLGYNFILTMHKSRQVKENMKIPLQVRFDGGINPFSGLLEIGVELGFVIKGKISRSTAYKRAFLNTETGEFEEESDDNLKLEKDTNNVVFWGDLIRHKPFIDAIEFKYKLPKTAAIDDETAKELDDLIFGKK